MPIKWKIFRVASIIETILIASLIGVGFYSSPLSLGTTSDLIGFIVILSMPLITAVNCINNIVLLPLLSNGENLPVGKKVFFWCLFVLFLAVVVVFSIVLGYGIVETTRSSPFARTNANTGVILVLIWGGIIVLNGLYLITMQLVLFAGIRKSIKKELLSAVDEIGKDDNFN